MRRHSHYLLASLVVASLLLGSCAPAAPAPTPTARPATEVAPTQAPKPAAEPTSAPAPTPTPVAKPASAEAPVKTYNWKMTTPLPPGHAGNANLKHFTNLLEERTNGAVKITLYESTLGDPKDAWDMVRSNTIQLTHTAEAYNAGRMPIISLCNLPFEVPDQTAFSLVANEWLRAGYLKELTDNFKVLYVLALPQFHLFLRDKKVTIMEDWKGLKVRSGSSVQSELVKALGGTPVSMPGGEVYMALDRKVVDSTITAAENVVDRKLFEVTRYALKEPFFGASFVVLMNKETWNSLSPDLQKTIEQISQEVASADLKRSINDEEGYWQTIGKKVEIYTINPEEQKRWRDVVMAAGIADKYVQETAAKGYPAKEALELMRKVVSDYKK